MTETSGLASAEHGVGEGPRKRTADEDEAAKVVAEGAHRAEDEVERDDERNEPEGIIDAHGCAVAKPAMDADKMEYHVRRRVVVLEVVGVQCPVEGERDPVGGHNAHESPTHEGDGSFGAGAEGEPDAAEDHKNIHAQVTVEEILPNQHPAGVVKNDEEDGEALEFIEHREPPRHSAGELDFDFRHGNGKTECDDGISISRARLRRP